MTAVSENGRITPFCPGLYSDDQVAAWRHIADFVHANSTAKLCVQLGHAGPRGATQAGSIQPDRPLTEGAWPLLAASAQSYKPDGQVPQEMPAAQMEQVKRDFVGATQRAIEAGFDMIEIQAGHGFLLSSFLTPLMNHRTDEFGGSLENRLRFPLEVVHAVREVWGKIVLWRCASQPMIGSGRPASLLRTQCA